MTRMRGVAWVPIRVIPVWSQFRKIKHRALPRCAMWWDVWSNHPGNSNHLVHLTHSRFIPARAVPLSPVQRFSNRCHTDA